MGKIKIILDNISLFFRRPNWKINDSVCYWEEFHRITGIYRDYNYNTFIYQLEGALTEPSEGVLKYYNTPEKIGNKL